MGCATRAGRRTGSTLDVQITLNMPIGMTVVLIDEDPERRRMMESLLVQSGYKVAPPVSRVDDLADACVRYDPHAVVVSTSKPTRALLDGLSFLRNGRTRPRPIVLFCEDGSPKGMQTAIEAGVSAYVVVGLNGNRVRSAVDLAFANFNQTESLRSQVEKAQEALRDRKVIERAKGILMKQRAIDEEDAYRLMRDRAMSRAVRLVDVARMITDAAEMLVTER